jgi:hypothetical protein
MDDYWGEVFEDHDDYSYDGDASVTEDDPDFR